MIRAIWGFFFGKKPVQFISNKRLERKYSNPRYVVVDIRPMGEYSCEYILGSINVPQTSFYKKSRKKLRSRQRVILVCRNGHVATNAYHILKERKFGWVRVLKGGINLCANERPELLIKK